MVQEYELLQLAQKASEHTIRFKQGLDHDPRYSYELFRLALRERDERAWELLYKLYKPQLERTAQRHPQFSDCDEDTEYFVNRAFERMWRAVTPDRFDMYETLPQLLMYMQMCVGTAILDYKKKPMMADIDEVDRGFDNSSLDTVDTGILNEEFWATVEAFLVSKEEKEFIKGYFIWGYSPRQLCETFPASFKNTKEVNRTRTSILNRLKRNMGTFLEFLGEDKPEFL